MRVTRQWMMEEVGTLTWVLLIPSSRRRVTSACRSNSVWATRSSCSDWEEWDENVRVTVVASSPPITSHASVHPGVAFSPPPQMSLPPGDADTRPSGGVHFPPDFRPGALPREEL